MLDIFFNNNSVNNNNVNNNNNVFFINKIDDNTIEVFNNECILGAEWLYYQQLLNTFNFKVNNYYNAVKRDKKYPDKIEEKFLITEFIDYSKYKNKVKYKLFPFIY